MVRPNPVTNLGREPTRARAERDFWKLVLPNVAPIKAYGEGRVFYLPTHPSPQPGTTPPSRCFASIGEVEAAGYRPAPPPAGGEVVGVDYFIPADPSLRTQCREAAEALGFPVPCPELVVAGTPCGSMHRARRVSSGS